MDALKARFESHPERHPGVTWETSHDSSTTRACAPLPTSRRRVVSRTSSSTKSSSTLRTSRPSPRNAGPSATTGPPAWAGSVTAGNQRLRAGGVEWPGACGREDLPRHAGAGPSRRKDQQLDQDSGRHARPGRALFGSRRYDRTFIYCNGDRLLLRGARL